MSKTWDSLLTSAPVNKAAAVVTNQHNVADAVAMNLMIEERRILRENFRAWNAECLGASQKRLKELRPIMRAAQARLTELNAVMRNNPDAKAAARFKSLNQAFMHVARETLPLQVFTQIRQRAEEVMKL